MPLTPFLLLCAETFASTGAGCFARCKLLRHRAYRGYNASKREYFYGFKVEVITTVDGLPVQFFIVAGSVHASRALQAMQLELPEGSKLLTGLHQL
ncbi:hypothetical protein ACMA1I_22995 [Pontibacter sp. 13R65]|uniref:hypothetical protein n=1 Tax=Pontibacter sp. 13R65 TaxID=3127458 RepID=UPI00301D0B60